MKTSHLKSYWRSLRSLLLALISTWAAAGPASATDLDPSVMESLGMNVASLQRNLVETEVRGLSQPTEHQAGVLELRLRSVLGNRRSIESLGRKLPPDSLQAKVLRQFLEDWSEARLADGFRTPRRDSALDPAVHQLAGTFPEVRHSKPWFPFFRP